MRVGGQAFVYSGSELEIFEQARNWKRYVAEKVQPYLGKKVLEVGAGMGSFTAHLCSGREQQWVCLEPDSDLAEKIEQKVQKGILRSCCEVFVGKAVNLPMFHLFDTILYLDVLEHIDDDKSEIQEACKHLSGNGYLVILSPAHNFLFTPFDESIGHFRRYNRTTLINRVPAGLRLVSLKYLDSVGILTLLANRLFLKSKMPTQNQIQFWDRTIVPFSKFLDPLTGFRIGKSILGIWQKG